MVKDQNTFQLRAPEGKNSQSYGQNRNWKRKSTRGYKTENSKNYRGPNNSLTNLNFRGDTSVVGSNNLPLRYLKPQYSKTKKMTGGGAESEITDEERGLWVFPPRTLSKPFGKNLNFVEEAKRRIELEISTA